MDTYVSNRARFETTVMLVVRQTKKGATDEDRKALVPKLQENRGIVGEAKAKFHGFLANTVPELPEGISVSAHGRVCRVLLDSVGR
jgi:hypothetical protein